MPTCWIIAGPNGAGKTTFALNFLPSIAKCHDFINADLIAAGLSPLAPENVLVSASKIFLAEIKSRILNRTDFAFETTLSGRMYLRLVEQLRAEGWHIEMIYLALPSVEVSISRVDERVRHGGHNILTSDLKRRFPKSLYNLFFKFGSLVNRCRCFMNESENPTLIFEQTNEARIVHNEVLYQQLIKDVGHDSF